MFNPAIGFLLTLLAAPVPVFYRVPEISSGLPQNEARLEKVARWAASRPTPPTIMELRRQMALQGVSLETIAAYYRDAAGQPENILLQLGETESAAFNNSRYLSQGGYCTPITDKDFWHCALIVAGSKLDHQPFPVSLPLENTLNFTATLPAGYTKPDLWLIRPNGTTVKIHPVLSASRRINAHIAATEAGQHQFELMANGPNGPEVLLNVPLFWGVDPTEKIPSWLGNIQAPPNLPPEQTLHYMINTSRKQQGLKPLEIDDQLNAVAQQKALLLAQNGQLAHLVGKNSPDEQLQAQGIAFDLMAENIAQAADPASAHYLLMTSPSHRLAILNREFTHLGLGIAHRPGQHGSEIFIVEELAAFSQSTTPQVIAQEILNTVNSQRQLRKLPPLTPKGNLTALAQKEAKKLLASGSLPQKNLNNSRFNIDYFLLGSPEDILKSPNISGKHNFIGIGIYQAGGGKNIGRYWVVLIFE